MNKLTSLLVLSLTFGVVQIQAAENPGHSIHFESPENFTDVRRTHMGSERETADILADLEKHMQRKLNQKFHDGHQVRITVKDITMAGDFEPWHGPSASDIRIVKDLYPARLSFSYEILDLEGNVVKAGDENRRDRGLGMTLMPPGRAQEVAPYVKDIFDQWLRSVRV